MTNNIIAEELIKSGFDEKEVDKMPVPLLLADLMPNQEMAPANKRISYDSPYHSTSKIPPTNFYKKTSSILNK